MGKLIVFFGTILSLAGLAQAAPNTGIGHYDLEMSGSEYRDILSRSDTIRPGDLAPVLALGKRNLDWLKHINQFRDEAHKLVFSSAETQIGTPIETPSKYNQASVLQDYQDALAAMPAAMRDVLGTTIAFPDNPTVEESDYLAWARKVDRVYSFACRWLMMQPWLGELANRRWMDVRGYYFLSREQNLESELKNWPNLPAQEKARLRPWLIGICVNANNSLSGCGSTLKKAEAANALWKFHSDYFPQAQKVWDHFFSLDYQRSDAVWLVQANLLQIPFQNPRNEEIHKFLLNIEEEWQINDWHLVLSFKNSQSNIPHIVFEPSVTPHVNGIGGNEITMDSNVPLTEYTVQWIIRHEFGHVLGFKDCYVEFYDSEDKSILNYQLDTSNLMCSRRGKLQLQHYDELKRVYAP